MRSPSFAQWAAELFQRVLAPGRQAAADGLQWDYSCATDVLSAWIGPPQLCDKVPVGHGVVIHISRQTRQPVGIDVLAASERSGQWPGALNGSYARALLDQHGPAALRKWRRSDL